MNPHFGQPRLIILDRDGVLNENRPDYVLRPEDWIPIPGSLEAVARLQAHGHTVVVATNQSAVGRGLLAPSALETVHARMRALLESVGGSAVDVYICPHGPSDGCDCRKPAPGLYRRILTEHPHTLERVDVIGDARRDLVPAWTLGLSAHLVRSGLGRLAENELSDNERHRTTVHNSLADYALRVTEPL
ncbi:MAG: HAD-IIIA family hydrolase [Gammaproteobacteria bacterium]|nr:HAD-IIIA family hydrolase [Gammaproteobacteria bacterium]